MSSKGKRSSARWLLAGVAAVVVVGGAVAAADPDDSGPSTHTPRRHLAAGSASSTSAATDSTAPSSHSALLSGRCGAAATQTIAAVDIKVAQRIYRGEISGKEVSADVAHVTGSQELLSALASSSTQAVYAAVHAIVYTPHWHIVRLRVVQNGRVLADVGGPYIIAPVSGSLRVNGRKVADFVMSVQDDAGYVKLVSHFLGTPIDLYRNGSLLMGTLRPAPPTPSAGRTVKVAGATYLTRVLDARAFPSGELQAAIFVSPPAQATAARSCAAVRVAAWGNVAKHIATRFRPLAAHYQELIGTIRGSTTGLAYVRVGSRQIAGLSVGPPRIPKRGAVEYRGQSWNVFSWEPAPPARIYFLTPPDG
jgi:hypothetical protein